MAADALLETFRRHGGRIAVAREVFPAAPLPWIDLSTGINPNPWPGPALQRRDLQRLPEPAEIAGLERSAAMAFGCRPEQVIAVPGADIGLRLLPRVLAATRVAIVSPTYGGHAEAWRGYAGIAEIARSEISSCIADGIILVNPNNPDGTICTRAQILDIAQRQRKKAGFVVVDESFADVLPDLSVASQTDDNLIVLRSFGKFYGLPGLRLGFIAAGEKVVRAIRALIGDWPVSVPAAILGASAYADFSWQGKARVRLIKDAARLDRELTRRGFDIVGGTPLFRLAARSDADLCFLRLAEAGILVRPFTYNRNWLRFGIPASAHGPRLRAALDTLP